MTPCAVAIPRERFELTGVSITPAIAAPGDSVVVTLGYRRDSDSPFGPDIIFHLRFDHESLPARRGVPGDKHLRRLRERTSGELFRFRSDLRAGHGVYEPDLWPIGVPLAERFRATIPLGAKPGVYRVELSAVEETLLPNFDVSDLLFNRDHYSGLACATIEVRPRGSRP